MSSAKNTIKNIKIKIPVSSIAPLVGLDHYKNFPKVVCELWRKYDRNGFKQIETDMQKKDIDIATDSEARRIVRQDIKNGTNIYQQTREINTVSGTSQCLQEKQKKIVEQIEKNETMNIKEKEELKKQVVSTTNKNHGINNETNVLKRYEQETGLKIASGQENMIYPFHTCAIKNIDWCLHGKYDGLTECGKLIEAKKRQKYLFKQLRDYEKVQIQTYLRMKECDKGSLIEMYSTKEGCESNIIDVCYEPEYVDDIFAKLVKFTDFFKEFIDNEEWRNVVLLGDKKREIYNMYVNDYLN